MSINQLKSDKMKSFVKNDLISIFIRNIHDGKYDQDNATELDGFISLFIELVEDRNKQF